MSDERPHSLLEAIAQLHKEDSDKHYFETMYRMLDVVDSKASALLTFNGVIIAGFALLAESADCVPSWFFYLAMFLPTTACFLCFRIVDISWPFLGKGSINIELKSLAQCVDERTNKYRSSFRLSVWSLMVFMVMLIYSLICTLFNPALTLN